METSTRNKIAKTVLLILLDEFSNLPWLCLRFIAKVLVGEGRYEDLSDAIARGTMLADEGPVEIREFAEMILANPIPKI